MKTSKIIWVILSVIAGLNFSCSKNSGGGSTTVDCSTVANKNWGANVSPIIQSSCAISGCHAAGSTNGPGPLTSYTEVFNARFSIRNAVANGSMPKNSSLSSSQKNSITCWIDSGAPNN